MLLMYFRFTCSRDIFRCNQLCTEPVLFGNTVDQFERSWIYYSFSILFPKCQTHLYTRFENGCSKNSTQKLLTKYSTEEKTTLECSLGPYSRPLAQFFPIRISQPANNICRFPLSKAAKHMGGEYKKRKYATTEECCYLFGSF